AFAVLGELVAGAKRSDPLAPTAVITPTNAAGVAARRWLGRHGGVAAVEVTTLARLAESLAGPELARAGRRPVSTPIVELALRDLLAADPGGFRAVAQHPST